jgi:hypothetical protein
VGISGERAQRSEVRCMPGYTAGPRRVSANQRRSEIAVERGKSRPGSPRRGDPGRPHELIRGDGHRILNKNRRE